MLFSQFETFLFLRHSQQTECDRKTERTLRIVFLPKGPCQEYHFTARDHDLSALSAVKDFSFRGGPSWNFDSLWKHGGPFCCQLKLSSRQYFPAVSWPSLGARPGRVPWDSCPMPD